MRWRSVSSGWLIPSSWRTTQAGDVNLPAYHRVTGCIDFPPEAWDAWYDDWVGQPGRDYWFVEDSDGELVGHAHYHVEAEHDGRRIAEIGASIHPRHRLRGLGLAAFAELVRRIRDARVADVVRNEFEPGRVAAVRIHRALGFRPASSRDELDPSRSVLTWDLPLREPSDTGRVLRPVEPADAEALGRSHYASWVESYARLLPPEFWETFHVEQRIEGWRRLLADRPAGSQVVVATVNGLIVGHAMTGPARDGVGDAYPAVRDRELYSVYLLAEHQGGGLGRRLVDAVLGADEPAQLWVFENNPRAIGFYEHLGFAPDGARHVFGPSLGNQAEIRMVR